MDHGRFLVVAPFVMAFMPDTGAYLIGCAFGKHKLCPLISPKKTVEGLFGGFLGGIVGMIVYGLVLQYFFGFTVNYLFAVLYGVLGAGFATFGDLMFSVIKRQTGIKDYGKLLPGHGGILDRFDSVTIVAPLAEVLLLILPLAVK
jgi:phosphatidate cytidylyltransferase